MECRVFVDNFRKLRRGVWQNLLRKTGPCSPLLCITDRSIDLLAVECAVFGDNSATEFHKLHSGIFQSLPRKTWAVVVIIL